MNSKTSCFKSIIKSDIKRMWWMSALFTVFMLLFVISPLSYVAEYGAIEYGRKTLELESYIFDNLTGYTFFAIVMGFCFSIKMFSYLNHVASVTFFHSLPLTRSRMFNAHNVSAIVLMFVPFLVCTIIGYASISEYCNGIPFLKAATVGIIYALVIYSLCTFVGMLTGNSAAQGIFTVVLLYLVPFLVLFFQTLCEHFFYGYPVNYDVPFPVDALYISFDKVLSLKGLVYIVLIVGFYFFSCFIYNKRHLENHGEVIAFPQFRNLFKTLFGICTGVLGYFYCYSFWNIKQILVMLIFGTVGAIVANMISNKSISLKGCLVPVAMNFVFVAVLFFVFVADITGYENRVPNVDEVKSIVVTEYTDDGKIYAVMPGGSDYEEVQLLEYYTPVFTEEFDIENFVFFHKSKVKDRRDEGFSYGWYDGIYHSIEFEYTLKNGSKLKRMYYLSDSDMNIFVKDLVESKEYKKYRYPILDGIERDYTAIRIEHPSGKVLFEVSADSEEGMKILEALHKDTDEMTFDDFLLHNTIGTDYQLYMTYNAKAENAEGKVATIQDVFSYNICADFDNVYNVLDEIMCDLNFDYLSNYSYGSVEIQAEKVLIDGEVYDADEFPLKKPEIFRVIPESMVSEYKISNSDKINAVVDYIRNREHVPFDKTGDYVFFEIELNYLDKAGNFENRFVFNVYNEYDNLELVQLLSQE